MYAERYGNRKAEYKCNITEANNLHEKNDHNFIFSGEETTSAWWDPRKKIPKVTKDKKMQRLPSHTVQSSLKGGETGKLQNRWRKFQSIKKLVVSDRQRQIMYDLIYRWNLKQTNEQTKNRLMDSENKLMVARDGDRGWAKWGKGTQRYELPVIRWVSPGM